MNDPVPPQTVTTPASRPPRRLFLLIFFGLLIVGGTSLYRHFRYARPIGHGGAGPLVARDVFESAWSERPVVLLGLGDSVTQGLGASPGMAYFNRLVKNPADEVPEMRGVCLSKVLPALQALNLSISGTTSIECVDYQLPKLTPYADDVYGIVVMTTGGNDVIHNYGRTPPREGAMFGSKFAEIGEWVTNYEQRLDTIANHVRQTFPGGCQIFIANIYDPTDGHGDIQHAGLPAWPDGVQVLSAYNDAIKRFADKHDDVHMIDMRSEFLGHGIHCTHFWDPTYHKSDPYYWYWENLEDPNDQGYDAVRRLFLTEIARTVPPKLQPQY